MIDAHCHVDLYPDPAEVAEMARRDRVIVVGVTNLPSAFARAHPHAVQHSNLRLALGLHPLLAHEHASERERFRRLLVKTSYIGEIGLDFSSQGYATKEVQVESFRFVLQAIENSQKFITLHSRRAESAVLDLLEEAGRSPVVFHWFSGSGANLDRAAALGHFFSINTAMINSQSGRRIIDKMPLRRVLTESDGPFVQIGGRVAMPSDVCLVEEYLASSRGIDAGSVRKQIRENFMGLVRPLASV